MRINSLRLELKEILENPDAGRRPALRRSLREEWLYTTDLPGLCTGKSLENTLRKLDDSGWHYQNDGEWLQLRKTIVRPPEGWYDGPFGREAGCCLSLLKRHPEKMTGSAERIIIQLIKAGEEGSKAYEQACMQQHSQFSGRLRLGLELPDICLEFYGN